MVKIFLENSYKLLWIIVPIFVAILLAYLRIVPTFIGDTIIMISIVIIFFLGMPLSVGVRLDQWSSYLGPSYSREVVLMLALIIPFLNLNILLMLKQLIFRKKVSQAEVEKRPSQKKLK